MNFMLSFGILFSVFVSLIYGQYYPHRKPVSPKSFIYSAKNDNPFKRAYENQGYYQKFQDYGKLKTKPLAKVTQHSNTYTNDKNRGKGEHNFNSDYHNYEDNNEYDFGAHLDYNDVIGAQHFNPFKYVTDSVAGVEEFGHFDGQESESDNLDYFDSYFN